MSDIKTRYEFPPIPDRRYDWCAWHDGDEETGHYGWGPTEREAIADLHRLDDERAEWEMYERGMQEPFLLMQAGILRPRRTSGRMGFMTPGQRREKIKQMRERLKTVPAHVQLARIWWHQTHCFKCEAEVTFDAEVCPACGEELM